MRGPSSWIGALALSAAVFGVVVAACTMPRPNDAEIGCAFDAESSQACPGYVTPGLDSGVPPGPAGDAGADAEGGAEAGKDTGLGAPCTGAQDCASHEANYCLISPNNSFTPFCTLTGCTAKACGASYVCCNCKASPVPQLVAFPANICVLPKLGAALPTFGCTCMAVAGDGG